MKIVCPGENRKDPHRSGEQRETKVAAPVERKLPTSRRIPVCSRTLQADEKFDLVMHQSAETQV